MSSNIVRLVSVDLGLKKVKVPVAQIKGQSEGLCLLITAGLDGDEYAGIEAAYKIIKEVASQKLKGRLIIIPIVNICGFEKKQSYNPLDGKFPKYVLFPGKKDGSSTERLMYWLSSYICNCDMWLDLHGGALDEWLPDSFIWAYETKNKKLNQIVKRIIRVVNVPKIVFEKPNTYVKIEALAKTGVAYLISEAGSLGSRGDIFIKKHIEIVRLVMEILGMMDKATREDQESGKEHYYPRIYRKVEMYKAKHQGLWYPESRSNSFLRKGRKLGEIHSYEGKLIQEVRSKHDGEYLWEKKGLSCLKDDILTGIGCELMDIVDI